MPGRTPESPEAASPQQIFTAREKKLIADYVRSTGLIVNEDALTDSEMVNLCDEIALYTPSDSPPDHLIGAIIAKSEEVKNAILEGLNGSPLVATKIDDNENIYSFCAKYEAERRKYPLSVRMKAARLELMRIYGAGSVKELDQSVPSDHQALALCEKLLAARMFVDTLKGANAADRRIAKSDPDRALHNRAFLTVDKLETRLRERGVIGSTGNLHLQQIMLDIAKMTGNVGEA